MMRSLVFVAVLGIYFTNYEVEALNKQCLTDMQLMLVKQTKLIVPCVESLGLTTPQQKKEKALCVMKCVMIKAEMLAPDGSVDMELAQKLLEGLPDALKEKASNVIGECGHHAAAFEPNEASCESYREFIGCMLDVAVTMCNE